VQGISDLGQSPMGGGVGGDPTRPCRMPGSGCLFSLVPLF
jgi:hypothetical protein